MQEIIGWNKLLVKDFWYFLTSGFIGLHKRLGASSEVLNKERFR